MEPGAPGTFAQSNIPVIHLQESTSQFQLDDKDELQQPKQHIMHGRHQQHWDDHSSQQEQFEQNQSKRPEQRQQHVDEQRNSAESNSFALHLQQFTSQPQGENQRYRLKDNKHEQQQEQEKKLMEGELQQQQNQQEDHSNQQELFQQSQPQHVEQGQPHFNEQSENLWLETLQVQQQQQKEEQEQHPHQEKQQYMQQSLQTHQQLQQLQLQPQVQQQQFNQQSLQAVTSGQYTSRSITFSYLVETILPHLSREKAECVSAILLKFKRNEITKNDFVSGTRKVVGDQILVQTVKQIQKKATLATSSTATLHHTLSAFGGPISGGHSSGDMLQEQMCIQMPSAPPSSAVGPEISTSEKVPLFGQNNCYESCPSNQPPRKKQKVSGDYLDQRVDPLNDITTISGVNLREEEEKLFAGPKDESCVAEAIRKVVQEEEERIFLQKGPLRAKIAGIMAKYGIKYLSTDSERCLSLCIEEHLRTVIGQLIRLSKQRVDLERVSHKVVLTSDIQHQILAVNKKVKVDLEKKQAEEEEKLQKLYGKSLTENNASTEGEKDESHAKIQRTYKEYDEMRSNAANAAVRAAIGGDDMLLKWQRMAEQAQQKHKGTLYQASNTCTNRDVSRKNMVGRLEAGNEFDRLDAPSTGIIQNLGREYPSSQCTQTEPVHTICVKDVIALLERKPHMTKSTLLYCLYERYEECNKEKPF
ncbi:transcription initiation factor TFIID subunit 4b isoform X2 [Cryptomeria japonica]|uniref:transcription initiation factor TFIID subunit 4b isoform X2 n=1 Tax=Cryptomeria japonica TaxID=3369 RepID=UPI0027DA7CDD|nr:transcription initiation factor TFIID subunit 4b isoform X2 [Cryptomeria japonica]